MTISHVRTIAILLFAGAVCSPISSLEASNRAEIADVRLTPQADRLVLGFRIENCFTPKMEEAILSGVPTTFRIRIVVEKTSPPFWGSKVVESSLERTIKYERLSSEFRVRVPEQPDKVLVTRDFMEAKGWMSQIRDLTVLPAEKLRKGERYELRVKAELSKFHLPLFLRYIFFFVSMWDFETDWHKMPFSP